MPASELDVERDPADRGHARAAGDGELDRLPRHELEPPPHREPQLQRRRLAGRAGRGAPLAHHPRQLLHVLQAPAAVGQLRRADEDDLVFAQQLAVELGREDVGPDDAELGPVRPHELERVLRLGHVVLDLDIGVQLVKTREQLGQQVQAGRSGGGERQRAGLVVARTRERPACVREQRLGSEHVVGEQSAVLRQLRAAGRPRQQPMAELRFELGDLLRNRRLADVELLGGAGERCAPRDRREGAQSGVQLHAPKVIAPVPDMYWTHAGPTRSVGR